MTTTRTLEVEPGACLVFEDAPVGFLAAARAGMAVIAVPSVFDRDDLAFDQADQILDRPDQFKLESLLRIASKKRGSGSFSVMRSAMLSTPAL